MFAYLRHIDLKLLVLGFFGCYFLPMLVMGSLVVAIGKGAPNGQLPFVVGSLLVLALLIVPPLAGGYFTARYSKTLPQLHILLLCVVGLVGYSFTVQPLTAFATVAAFSIACTALGAFIWFRQERRRRPGA
jgi:hypothetical protein